MNLEFDSRVNWTNGLSSMEMKVIVWLFFSTYGTYGETAASWCATSCKKVGKVVGATEIFIRRVSKYPGATYLFRY